MENLLKLLAEQKGRIVSTSSLSVALISYAEAENRMFVDDYGQGFVYIPDEVRQSDIAIRRITDHKNNKFNRECVEVHTADERGSDNANHVYKITVYHDYTTGIDNVPVDEVTLHFQDGGLKEVGANGITDQALIAVVLDRVRSFNDGQFRCRENSMIVTKLEEAMMWMEKRSNDRARRGVEGERLQ